jgi:hypothetical protein
MIIGMAGRIKLDLHTHPIEAVRDKMGIKGIRDIKREVASYIVKSIKNSGIDGIAITEFGNFNHSWVTALEIGDHFRSENLTILPGVEINYKGQRILQIYIPDYIRKRFLFFKGKEWFLILAHPGYYNPINHEALEQIRFDAVEEKSVAGEFPPASRISQEKSIPGIKTSDAHKLEEIGRFYMELEMI